MILESYIALANSRIWTNFFAEATESQETKITN